MSTSPTSGPLDPHQLSELRDLFGSDAEVASLFEEFFVELPDRMNSIQVSLRNGVAEGIERAAHAISGSSGSLGAVAVHLAAKSLEQRAHQGEVDHLEDLLVELEMELSRLREHLAQEGLLLQA
jgi:HPt (histidine-containing phosphotransfer) domain-containing protein